MPDDYRVAVGWSEHPKRWRMYDALGPDAVLAIADLWEWVAMNRPDGDLGGLTPREVARAAKLRGVNEAEWIDLMARPFKEGGCGLLDGGPLTYVVHDWPDRNPYVAGHERRSEIAREAAKKRWSQRGGSPSAPAPDARSNARSMRRADAPSGSVSDPIHPDPDPDPKRAARAAPDPEKKNGTTAVLDPETRGKLRAVIDGLGRKKGRST